MQSIDDIVGSPILRQEGGRGRVIRHPTKGSGDVISAVFLAGAAADMGWRVGSIALPVGVKVGTASKSPKRAERLKAATRPN